MSWCLHTFLSTDCRHVLWCSPQGWVGHIGSRHLQWSSLTLTSLAGMCNNVISALFVKPSISHIWCQQLLVPQSHVWHGFLSTLIYNTTDSRFTKVHFESQKVHFLYQLKCILLISNQKRHFIRQCKRNTSYVNAKGILHMSMLRGTSYVKPKG